MQLAALVSSPDHVCCRYRLRAFQNDLAAAGHTLELHRLPDDWWGRWRLGSGLRDADAVILQRRLLPIWLLRLLRGRVRRLIFDLDDAIFLRNSFSPKGLTSTRRWQRFAAAVQAADVVVAGNAWLREQAVAAGATNALVIPTCVNPQGYPRASHVAAGPGVRLVWIGSASTLQGLERARPFLEAAGAAIPGLRLKLICDKFLPFERFSVERCPWSEATDAAEIASADIGISWVPDDDWSRGKCGLKVLQYMAAGLPVVANPVGVQSDLIRHGENGLLAATPQEWVDAVARLVGDPALRRRMGGAGRRRVEESYSVTAGSRLWLDLLASLDSASRLAG